MVEHGLDEVLRYISHSIEQMFDYNSKQISVENCSMFVHKLIKYLKYSESWRNKWEYEIENDHFKFVLDFDK